MAVDFDFDTDYNDEEDEDNTPDEDFDEDEEFEEEEEEQSRSPLRMILLALLVLVLLCGGCFLGSQFIPIPGLGGSQPAEVAAPPQDTATPADVDAAVAPEDGQDGAAGEGEAAEGDETGETDETATGEEGAAGESGDETTADGATAEGEGESDAAAGEAGEGDEMATGDGETADGETDGATADGEGESDAAAGEASEGDEMAGGEGEAADSEAGEGDSDTADESGETEADGEEEPGIIINVTPVPGPTATPGAGAAQTTPASCDDNSAPTADAGGPYEAMMGKGQAVVTFDGRNSTDSDGTIDSFAWDFGDGNSGNGATIRHAYGQTGTFTVTLTITDNCGDDDSDTAPVTIDAASPPTTATVTATPSTTATTATPSPTATPGVTPTSTPGGDSGYTPPPVDPDLGTLGFCYQVQRGDTLWGISSRFGVPRGDLAYVNGISPEYYVVAGEGLFVPVREINTYGPNIYQARPGDTLHSIAYLCDVPVSEVARLNRLQPDAQLSPGQIVQIPPPWSY